MKKRIFVAILISSALIVGIVIVMPILSRLLNTRTILRSKPVGRIVYEQKGDIRIWNFSRAASEIVVSGPNCRYPRFSLNGEWILFKYESVGEQSELWIVRSDGNKKQKLCFLHRGVICFWRNDSEIVALDSLGESYRIIKVFPKIKILDWQPIEVKGGWTKNPSQAVTKISSLGDKYPFIYCSSDGKYYIKGIHPCLLLTPDGTRLVLPHSFGYHINNIDRGKIILNIRDVASEKDLFGLVSDEIDFFILDPNDGGYPRWSPDSRKLVFDSTRNTSTNLIWICELDNSGKIALRFLVPLRSHKRNLKGAFLERYFMPCWSPDGRYIACSHTVPSVIDKIQPIHLSWHGKTWIYVHDLETNKGIDFFEGSAPDWHM